MALERKPVRDDKRPEYPDVEAYSAGRRKYLISLGVLGLGLVGAVIGVTVCNKTSGVPSVKPQVKIMGGIMPPQPPEKPKEVPPIPPKEAKVEPVPVQPQMRMGKIRVIHPPKLPENMG